MIKNLLNADEDPPPGTKVIIEDSIVDPPAETRDSESPAAVEETSGGAETPAIFEIPESAEFFTKPSETARQTERIDEDSESLSALAAEIENLDPEDLKLLEAESFTNAFAEPLDNEPEIIKPAETAAENPPVIEQISDEKTADFPSGTLFQSEVKPQSTGETIRQSGLAYSAAIILFGSVVFMMIFGWLADWMLGSSPWGIVGGIILGGVIGFIQFFRITSQIFKK